MFNCCLCLCNWPGRELLANNSLFAHRIPGSYTLKDWQNLRNNNTWLAGASCSQNQVVVRNSETSLWFMNVRFEGMSWIFTAPDSIARWKAFDFGTALSGAKSDIGHPGPRTDEKCKIRGAKLSIGRVSIIAAAFCPGRIFDAGFWSGELDFVGEVKGEYFDGVVVGEPGNDNRAVYKTRRIKNAAEMKRNLFRCDDMSMFEADAFGSVIRSVAFKSMSIPWAEDLNN